MDLTFSDASPEPSAVTSKKKTILLIAGILGTIALGITALIFFSPKNNLPKAFFSAFDHQNAIESQILINATFDYTSLGTALKSQDYQKAMQLMQLSLLNTQKAEKQIEELTATTIALKKLLPQLKDNSSAQTILQLFQLIDDRNNKITALITEEQPFFSGMRDTYSQVLKAGKAQIPQGAEQQAKKILDDTVAVQAVQTQIATLYAGLKKDAGIDDSSILKTDDMQKALSSTPVPTTLLPTISDTPTDTPTFGETLPVGPVLPEGATTSANTTATGSAK